MKKRAEFGAGTGWDVRQIGKPRSRFQKTDSLVYKKRLLAFRKPTPCFPDLTVSPTHIVLLPYPFRRRAFPVLSDTFDPFRPDFQRESVSLLMRKSQTFHPSRCNAAVSRQRHAPDGRHPVPSARRIPAIFSTRKTGRGSATPDCGIGTTCRTSSRKSPQSKHGSRSRPKLPARTGSGRFASVSERRTMGDVRPSNSRTARNPPRDAHAGTPLCPARG